MTTNAGSTPLYSILQQQQQQHQYSHPNNSTSNNINPNAYSNHSNSNSNSNAYQSSSPPSNPRRTSAMLTNVTSPHASMLPTRREQTFGDYVVGRTLGEGEFGKVKLGVSTDGSGVQVAIKFIRKESVDTQSRATKIEREIGVLRRVRHPNIVKMFDVYNSDRHIGIVLEYASGGELFDYILKNRYLKDNIATRLFAELISGVHYLHLKGVVHRDLKLENLLLDKTNSIIITDFGFANTFDISTADDSMSGVKKGDLMSTSCGSPCYAAPELVVNDGLYTARKVDVWSCGVILYAMLAGYLPFDDDPNNPEGDNINLLYKYIVNTPLTFPEYITPLARDLLRKMLVPNPRKRATLAHVMAHSWLSHYQSLFATSIDQFEFQTMASFPHHPGMARSASSRDNASALQQKRPTAPHGVPTSRVNRHTIQVDTERSTPHQSVPTRTPHSASSMALREAKETQERKSPSQEVYGLEVPRQDTIEAPVKNTTPSVPVVPKEQPNVASSRNTVNRLPVPVSKPRPMSYQPNPTQQGNSIDMIAFGQGDATKSKNRRSIYGKKIPGYGSRHSSMATTREAEEGDLEDSKPGNRHKKGSVSVSTGFFGKIWSPMQPNNTEEQPRSKRRPLSMLTTGPRMPSSPNSGNSPPKMGRSSTFGSLGSFIPILSARNHQTPKENLPEDSIMQSPVIDPKNQYAPNRGNKNRVRRWFGKLS